MDTLPIGGPSCSRLAMQRPDFELADETGTPRKLSDLLARGPVVLFFYPMASR